MPRCEDYPCCGHTAGDPCPERDANGNIVPRCCICDGRLPKGARSSICAKCQKRQARRDRDDYGDHDHSMDY